MIQSQSQNVDNYGKYKYADQEVIELIERAKERETPKVIFKLKEKNIDFMCWTSRTLITPKK